MAWSRVIQIGRNQCGDNHPALIIAEIGANHNQDIEQAMALIDAAAECGANVVKFQSLKLDEVHHIDHVSEDFKRFFQQIELNESWYGRLVQHSEKRGVIFLSSPTYYQAIELLANIPVSAFKIASAQFGIHPWLVEQAARTGIPLIVSTGLVTFEEVAAQLRIIAETGNHDLVLLHCVSRYPTPIEVVNLRLMTRYQDAFGCLVGFSDHTLSLTLPSIAVALGACAIEKHITLDRSLPGPDHHFALEPCEFEKMVRQVRETESALGEAEEKVFSEEEEQYRESFIYKCVTGRAFKAGERLDDLERFARRANGGIDVRMAHLLLDEFVAAQEIPAGKLLFWGDVQHVEE